jgi:hypothetical protein
VLVDIGSWRAGFLSIVPFTLIAWAVAYRRVPEPPMRRNPPAVDWLGSVLAIVGLGAIVFAVIAYGTGTADRLTPALAALVGAASLIGLGRIESRAAWPMVSLEVFRSPAFRAVNLLTLLLYFAVTAVFFVLPFNLVQVHGYSATLTGAAYLPFGVILAGLSPSVGALADRLGMKPLLVVGPVTVAAGLALFAVAGAGGSYWLTFFGPMASRRSGHGPYGHAVDDDGDGSGERSADRHGVGRQQHRRSDRRSARRGGHRRRVHAAVCPCACRSAGAARAGALAPAHAHRGNAIVSPIYGCPKRLPAPTAPPSISSSAKRSSTPSDGSP